jgi:hypothetical protein
MSKKIFLGAPIDLQAQGLQKTGTIEIQNGAAGRMFFLLRHVLTGLEMARLELPAGESDSIDVKLAFPTPSPYVDYTKFTIAQWDYFQQFFETKKASKALWHCELLWSSEPITNPIPPVGRTPQAVDGDEPGVFFLGADAASGTVALTAGLQSVDPTPSPGDGGGDPWVGPPT